MRVQHTSCQQPHCFPDKLLRPISYSHLTNFSDFVEDKQPSSPASVTAPTSDDNTSSLAKRLWQISLPSYDGRTGTFSIGNDKFPASLLDLPGVVESYKTYDDTVLIKTADIGQIITVREEDEPAPEGLEYRHGLTPPMRDARRRRFRREPDLNPELVQRVEKDLLNIMSGGTVERSQADDANCERRKTAQVPASKPDVVPTGTVGDGEPERSDSDDSMEHEN